MEDLIFYAECVEKNAACKDEGDAQKAHDSQPFAEEEPGNHGGDKKAYAAPGSISKGEIQGKSGFGEYVEA